MKRPSFQAGHIVRYYPTSSADFWFHVFIVAPYKGYGVERAIVRPVTGYGTRSVNMSSLAPLDDERPLRATNQDAAENLSLKGTN